MKEVILHCSDSVFGNAALFAAWHIIKEKWPEIGYNYIILNGRIALGDYDPSFDGQVETGRTVKRLGAHCYGKNDAIGICLVGKSGLFTSNQWAGLKRLLLKLHITWQGIEISQHSDWDSKKSFCAGLSIQEMNELKKHIKEGRDGHKKYSSKSRWRRLFRYCKQALGIS